MDQMTVVSLFAGIGGIDRAFESAGARVVAAVEIDQAARGVIADRMPDTTLFTDVCEVTPDDLIRAGFDPANGVLTGGWPCQDLSVAGRRLGLGGARSGLFFEIVRLAAGLRPRWLCLENVPGLLSAVCPCLGGDERACGGTCDAAHPVRGGACGYANGVGRCMELHGGAMGAVLGALADLGYGVAYRVLDAQHFGVPQRRRRVVIVGCLGDWAAPVEVLLEPEGRRGDPAPGRTPGAGTAVVTALRAGSGGGCGPDDNDAQGGRLIAGALTTGASTGGGWRLGPDEAAANQLVVAPALTARYGKGTDSDATDGLLPVAFDAAQITSAENRVNRQPGDPSMPLAATGSPHIAFAPRADPGGTGQGHNTTYVPFGGEGVAHARTAAGHDASEDGTGRGTPLVPVSIAVAGDFSTGENIAQTVRAANGQPGCVAAPVAFDWQTDGSDRARPNISQARTSSLQTEKRDAVATATAVRRLTPTECERLQGFPDGWTATSWGKPQADSPRYRQLGNSVAVPVFAWVARRLVRVNNHPLATEAADGYAR